VKVREIKVGTGAGAYPVLVGRGLLAKTGRILRARLGSARLFVVTSAPVGRRYAPALMASIRRAGLRARVLTIPDGERAKTWGEAGRLLRRLARAGAGRDDVIVALGGGTVGDLAGFAAAVYARGIRCAQVPTTLLAQVDSSLGGKTGVDLPEGKNLAGAFHRPAVVISDPGLLSTLPASQVRSGLAEAVKHGVISSAALFSWMERNAAVLAAGDIVALERAVLESVRIKAAVVTRDEKESGERMILNFGHTAAHALEAAGGFRRLSHGAAVAIGMVAAARLSVLLGACPESVPARIGSLLRSLGLPIRPPAELDRAKVISAMAVDKKRRHGRLRVVLTRRIGDVTVRNEVNPQLLMKALYMQGVEQ
jgi:3-dehydroquinate synthase